MPFYKYAGVNKKGETVRGSIDADDEKGARQALLAQGVRIDSLKKDWTNRARRRRNEAERARYFHTSVRNYDQRRSFNYPRFGNPCCPV